MQVIMLCLLCAAGTYCQSQCSRLVELQLYDVDTLLYKNISCLLFVLIVDFCRSMR